MVDYDFYVNSYLGSAIPEKAFSGVAARAAERLQRLKSAYRVSPCGTASEKMALCAMAEVLYAYAGRQRGIVSASMGGVSVRYENSAEKKALNRELYECARCYLDIYRGVGQ